MTLQTQQYSLDRNMARQIVSYCVLRISFRTTHHAQRITNHGLTVVELLISIAITSIIMLAIGSSMVIATRAMPDVNTPANTAITAGEIAEQLATELQYAISIKSYSANMIEFTVANRSGYQAPDIIRYEWSGTQDDPLTRKYNGASVVEVLDSVQEFNLSYDIEAISDEVMPGNESAETLLIGYHSTQDLDDFQLLSYKWYGQYFLPSLPLDAVSWKVTRIEFYAKVDRSPTGECRVELQLPTGDNLPSGVVLEDKRFLEETLNESKYLRQQFTFSNVSGLSAQQGLCLVFRPVSGSYPAQIWGQDEGVSTPNSYLIRSDDSGGSWSAQTNQSLLFSIYGTVTTSGQPSIQNTYYVNSVRIKLRTGQDEQSIVYAAAKTINKPEVKQ
jgi:hypothetical protein